VIDLPLTWNDIVTPPPPADVAARCLRDWAWLYEGEVAPVILSKFGDWYLRQPDGGTVLLDVLEGTVGVVARTPAEFDTLLANPDWVDEFLLVPLVARLRREGKVPGPGECYGFAPPPRLSGTINPAHALVMNLEAWQLICAQFARVPPGTPVSHITVNGEVP
jgi:hypothetical protein